MVNRKKLAIEEVENVMVLPGPRVDVDQLQPGRSIFYSDV